MRVLKVSPGEKPKFIDIPNELEALQKEVEGNIECVGFFNSVVICNEEGAINDMEFNVVVSRNIIYGPLLLVGIAGEEAEFCDVSDNEAVDFIIGWTLSIEQCDRIREMRLTK